MFNYLFVILNVMLLFKMTTEIEKGSKIFSNPTAGCPLSRDKFLKSLKYVLIFFQKLLTKC